MNEHSTKRGTSAVSVLLSFVLGLTALFFGFGSIGFVIVALAAVAGKATGGELATILGIGVFSLGVTAACVFGIVMLNRRG